MTTHCKLDIYNTTGKVIDANATFTFNPPLLDSQKKHKVIVTRADYSVNGLPIHYNDTDIVFTLRSKADSSVIIKTCVFKQGFYKNIKEILDAINTQISTEIGTFKHSVNTGKITFISSKGNAATQELYFPWYLKNLFDFFLYEEFGDSLFVLKEKDTANDTFQEFSTVDRFFNRKAIRIEAEGMGAKPTVENDTIDGYSKTMLLTDQALYGSGSTDRLIYIPSQFREIELMNNDRITRITLNVKVEWANGHISPLKITPDSYVNVLLMFQEI